MKKHGMLMTPENAQKSHDGVKDVTRRLLNPQPPEGCQPPVLIYSDEVWQFQHRGQYGDAKWFHAQPRYCPGMIVAIKETWWQLGRWKLSHSKAGRPSWTFEAGLVNGEGSWTFVDPGNQPAEKTKTVYHKRPGMIAAIKEPWWQLGRWKLSHNKAGRPSWTFDSGLVNGEGSWPFVDPENQPAEKTKTAYHKRPGLFLPYDYARTHVEILSARPEALWDIKKTPEDCLREGVSLRGSTADAPFNAVRDFRALWDSIDAKKAPWESNPWVWRYEYRRVENPCRVEKP